MQERSDHDLLITIDVKLTELALRLSELAAQTGARLSKHDMEIEQLQKFKWLLVGGAAVIEFAIHAWLRY